MSAEHELNRDADVDLGGIFASIWRNKGKLLFVSFLATVLAWFVLQTISPRYEGETRILIRASQAVLSSVEGGNARATELDDQGIASQVQLLGSRSIAEKVIEKLNLASQPEFGGKKGTTTVDTVLYLLGLSNSSKPMSTEDRVMEAFKDRLNIFQADRARVAVVEFWSNDPQLAADVPNAIASEYLALQQGFKRGAGPEELAKLEPELKSLRESVMKAEAQVAEFRASSDLLPGSNNTSISTQELSEVSTELGRVRAQLSTAKANADAVTRALKSNSLDTVSRVQSSQLIQRLRERQVALNGQLTNLNVTLLPSHPRIQAVQQQLTALDAQIKAEARKIEAALREDVKIAEKRQEDLIAERDRLKSEAARVGKAQVELRALEREADAQRQLLNQYLVRFQEARSRQSREFLPADGFIFAKAQVPSAPYFPKKIPTLIGVFLGTFVLGSMITLALSILSGDAVRQPALAARSDASREALQAPESREVPELAATNQQAANVDRSIAPAPALASPSNDGPSVERETVLPPLEEITTNTVIAAKSLSLLGRSRVAVLAPQSELGSAGVVHLARELAVHKVSVVIVDMTGDAGSSNLMLHSRTMEGITDALAGTVSIASALHRDRNSSVHIMPRGTAAPERAAQNAEKLPSVLAVLQQAYDYVLIDCGGVDMGGLKRVSDSNTFNIVSAKNAHSDGVDSLCRMLVSAELGAPLVVELSDQEKQLVERQRFQLS